MSTEAAEEERSNYLPIPILTCKLVEQSTSLSQVRGDGHGDHVGDSAEGSRGDGAISNGIDDDACEDAESGGIEGVDLEINRLKVQMWLLGCYM